MTPLIFKEEFSVRIAWTCSFGAARRKAKGCIGFGGFSNWASKFLNLKTGFL
jgi:hypothetical protein